MGNTQSSAAPAQPPSSAKQQCGPCVTGYWTAQEDPLGWLKHVREHPECYQASTFARLMGASASDFDMVLKNNNFTLATKDLKLNPMQLVNLSLTRLRETVGDQKSTTALALFAVALSYQFYQFESGALSGDQFHKMFQSNVKNGRVFFLRLYVGTKDLGMDTLELFPGQCRPDLDIIAALMAEKVRKNARLRPFELRARPGRFPVQGRMNADTGFIQSNLNAKCLQEAMSSARGVLADYEKHRDRIADCAATLLDALRTWIKSGTSADADAVMRARDAFDISIPFMPPWSNDDRAGTDVREYGSPMDVLHIISARVKKCVLQARNGKDTWKSGLEKAEFVHSCEWFVDSSERRVEPFSGYASLLDLLARDDLTYPLVYSRAMESSIVTTWFVPRKLDRANTILQVVGTMKSRDDLRLAEAVRQELQLVHEKKALDLRRAEDEKKQARAKEVETKRAELVKEAESLARRCSFWSLEDMRQGIDTFVADQLRRLKEEAKVRMFRANPLSGQLIDSHAFWYFFVQLWELYRSVQKAETSEAYRKGLQSAVNDCETLKQELSGRVARLAASLKLDKTDIKSVMQAISRILFNLRQGVIHTRKNNISSSSSDSKESKEVKAVPVPKEEQAKKPRVHCMFAQNKTADFCRFQVEWFLSPLWAHAESGYLQQALDFAIQSFECGAFHVPSSKDRAELAEIEQLEAKLREQLGKDEATGKKGKKRKTDEA